MPDGHDNPDRQERARAERVAALLAVVADARADGSKHPAARAIEDAWRELIGLYGRRVYALARSRCHRDDVAEEITQSVFATVAAKLGSGNGYTEEGRFEAWLFRIAMNRIRDEVRRRRRHAEPSDPTTFARMVGAEDHQRPDEDTLSQLQSALDRLPPQDREIIELRHHGGMSFRDMSDLLEEPLGTLLARHHRALRKLRQMMESEEQEVRPPAPGDTGGMVKRESSA